MPTPPEERAPRTRSPYRGIRPFRYSDHKLFYGREETVEALLVKVLVSRLVVLYGESGTGKSSLLNAGLIPVLEKEALAPERLRVRPIADEPLLIERIPVGSSEEGLFLPSIFVAPEWEGVGDAEAFLPCSLDRLERTVRGTERYPVLIFDQFEELFTLFGQHPESADKEASLQADILDAIFRIVSDPDLKAKVIITIREDFLGRLEVLAKEYPPVFDHRIRLDRLNRESALQAILGPFEDPNPFPALLTPDLAELIIKELGMEQPGAAIGPTQLQIVCRRLWDQYAGEKTEITIQDFETLGGISGILEGFLNSELGELSEAEMSQALAVLSNLITESETRDVVSEDRLRRILRAEQAMGQDGASEPPEVLSYLERHRVIYRTARRGTYYYELAHDYLIKPIQQLVREQEIRSAERDAQAKTLASMTRFVPYALVLVVLVLGAFAWIVVRQRNAAREAQTRAEIAAQARATQVIIAREAQAQAEAEAQTRATQVIVALDALTQLEANIQEQQAALAGQPTAVPTSLPTSPPFTATATRNPRQTATPTRRPLRTPTPTATSKSTSDATATAAALETQLEEVRAMQASVAQSIYTEPLVGLGLIQITGDRADEYAASYSPDQRTLVFQSNRSGNWELYTAGPEGNNWRQITDNGAADVHPRFSPLGNRIVFVSNVTGDQEIYTMAMDGTDWTRLTDSAGSDAYPSYSRDARQVIFMSRRSGTWGIYVLNTDSGQLRPIIDTDHNEAYPYFSPNGQSIVFQSDRSDNWDIFTVSIDGRELRQLTQDSARDANPVYSPDGNQIVFETNRDGDYEIYVMNADGSNLRNRTNLAGSDDQVPSISPDGQWIVFQSNRKGSWDIFRTPLTPFSFPRRVLTIPTSP